MFKKIAVIGSGVMGCGIAAQIANNNFEVLLFDLKKDGKLLAKDSIDKMLESKNSQFTSRKIAQKVIPKSIKDDLNELSEYDLVIEAIVENLDIKKNLYNKLSLILPAKAVLASNTSTFMLSTLTNGLAEDFKKKMVITHFFNPPRIMRLLELVRGDLEDSSMKKLKNFLSKNLGKDVIECKDSPGFIANRFGCYLMELTLRESLKTNIPFNIIDNAFINYANFPQTGIFGLYDLIGIDVMSMISKSLKASLSADDDFHNLDNDDFINKITSKGYLGRKSGSGFYKLKKDSEGKKSKYILNKETLEYSTLTKASLEKKNLTILFKENSNLSTLLKTIFSKFFDYITHNSSDVTDNINDIDKAMKLGFGWKNGPYKMMISAKGDILEDDIKSNFSDEETNINPTSLLKLKSSMDLKLSSTKSDYNIYKFKDRKIIFEIKTKSNILTSEVFEGILQALSLAESEKKELIFYSDSKHFCAGANLEFLYNLLIEEKFDEIKSYIELGQKTITSLQNSSIPIISCARGAALGGGCEILLHSDFIIAHQELTAGLVESSIGLIPAWGGTKELILNSEGKIDDKLMLILKGYKSTSAQDFKEKFSINNIKSIAGIDDLLEYALENNFTKKNRKNNQIEASDILINTDKLSNLQLEIFKLLKEKITGKLSENDLLDIEIDIFFKLLKTQEAKSLLENYR